MNCIALKKVCLPLTSSFTSPCMVTDMIAHHTSITNSCASDLECVYERIYILYICPDSHISSASPHINVI